MATKTEQAILTAFSDLVAQFGYQGATTKKIAEAAQVNESTIFRHFGDKEQILQALVAQYQQDFTVVKQQFKMTGNVEDDLIQMVSLYTEFAASHQAVIIVGLQNVRLAPQLEEIIQTMPLYLRSLSLEVFTKMQEAGEINAELDRETEVDNFFFMMFGWLVARAAYPKTALAVAEKVFVSKNIRQLAQHLQ